MQLSINEVRSALIEKLAARGLDTQAANDTAEGYIEWELMGKKSHGLMAFPLETDEPQPFLGKEMKVIKKSHSILVMDADGLPGAHVGKRVVDELTEMAQSSGVAVGYIKNMKTWLRPGSIAKYITDQNMVGLVINNGGSPMVAPPGGYDPVIGTNPIGLGIPTKGSPIVTDMATSKRAWWEVRKASAEGVDLPKKSFYNNQWEFAIAPSQAHSARAMGDYKGFSLGLFVEIMTGSFLGRDMSITQTEGDYQTASRWGMIMVFDPAHTTDYGDFIGANSSMVEAIKSTNSREGEEITFPGERAYANKEANEKQGVLEVEESWWRKLTQ